MNKKLEQKIIEQVKRDPDYLKDIEEQTEAICLAAVKAAGWAVKHVNNQTEEICLAAVKEDGNALRYVKNQTEKICLATVKDFGNALEYVNNQTEAICLEAVKENVLALNYVKNKTNKIYKEALNYNFKDSSRLIPIKEKSTAMIVLEASLRNNKDRVILTKILNKFSKDQEIIDFYTKHKLWKHVDFNKLKNHKLFQYGMPL